MNTTATATYRDIWAGDVAARVVSFPTKRKGERVTRYRWRRVDGQSCGGFASPFKSVAGAVAAARRHACFANVVEA